MHTSNQATESYRNPSYVAVKKKSRQRRRRAEEAIYCIYPICSKRNKKCLTQVSLKSHSQSHSKEQKNYSQLPNLPPNPNPVNYAAHCTQNAGKSSASLSSLSLLGGVSPIGSATRLCFALERKKKEGRREKEGRKKEAGAGGRTARMW